MKVIGIVGNIGSGKSTAASYLKKKGIPVLIDGKINGQILKDEKIRKEISKILDLKLFEITNRKLLSIITTNKSKKKKLEKLLQPLVTKNIKKYLKFFENKGFKWLAIESAIMIKLKLVELIDYLMIVQADYDIRQLRLERLKKKPFSGDSSDFLALQDNDIPYLQLNVRSYLIKNIFGIAELYETTDRTLHVIMNPDKPYQRLDFEKMVTK